MGARRSIGVSAFALLAGVLGVSCSDDPPEVASQDEYDEAAADLCARHGGEVLIEAANLLVAGTSDAQIVSFLRTEYVPNIRAIVRGLSRNGFPVEKASEYTGALTSVQEALNEVDEEDEAYSLVDRLRRGMVVDDENPITIVHEGMETADVDCGRQAPALDPES